jgi:Protein of unknown function (DUF1353)
MSSFTAALKIVAIRRTRSGWRALIPPGFLGETWAVGERFDYAVGSLEAPIAFITVPEGFVFDGASIPPILSAFLPRSHSDYVQAAALHDWLYRRYHSHVGERRIIADRIFAESLAVLGVSPLWRWALYFGVRIGGWRAWHKASKQRSQRRD